MTGEDKLPVLARFRAATPIQPVAAAAFGLDPRIAPPAAARQPLRTGPDSAPPAWATGAGSGRAGVAAGAAVPHGTKAGRDAMARRILSLHLPRFAVERWSTLQARRPATGADAQPDDRPLALVLEGPHGPVVHAVSAAAERAGVRCGSRVVDMRALCPDLRVAHADPGADLLALRRLMLWARRWCPWTAVDGTDALVLDITGSDHLWGGEAALLHEIETRLAGLGLTAALAIAPTRGAAWALARFGTGQEICSAEALTARIAPLPVRALRLDATTVLALDRLGLSRVATLAQVPRLSLARRFGRGAPWSDPLLRLDQITGQVAEPIDSPDDPPRFAVTARLAEPVIDPLPHLPALAAELCAALEAAGFGARRVTLTLYRTDGEVAATEAATSQPSRDAGHLLRLFDGRLERLDPGFGFDLIALAASVAEALPGLQRRLDGGAETAADLARLVDRLSARFGAQALTRPMPRGSHIPERQTGWIPALSATAPGAASPPRRDRPLRLFASPEEVRVLYAVPEGPPAQFVWRRQTLRVARFAGPERIAPEWWSDRPGSRLRDYYRVEDQNGRRFWLYREGVLQDGRGGVPRWFVHGAFG